MKNELTRQGIALLLSIIALPVLVISGTNASAAGMAAGLIMLLIGAVNEIIGAIVRMCKKKARS